MNRRDFPPMIGAAFLAALLVVLAYALWERGLYEWLKDFGSIVGALVAVGAAWLAWRGIQGQIRHQRRANLIQEQLLLREAQRRNEAALKGLAAAIEVVATLAGLFDFWRRDVNTSKRALPNLWILGEAHASAKEHGLPLVDLRDEDLLRARDLAPGAIGIGVWRAMRRLDEIVETAAKIRHDDEVYVSPHYENVAKIVIDEIFKLDGAITEERARIDQEAADIRARLERIERELADHN